MNENEANKRSNFFAASGKRVIQEQQEQMLIREDQKYKLQQYHEDQIQERQEPVPVYLEKNDRQQKISAAQRKEIIRNIDIEANRNSDGGIFAKVYKQKDAKDQQQQTQKQAYIDEIQRQIDEKKRRKEEERQKQIDEDRKFEERLKKEREKMNQNQNKEDDKKMIIKTIKNKHLRQQQQDDSKFIFNEFEDHQINLTNNIGKQIIITYNIVPNYLKEVDDKYDQELKHKLNPHTPQTKLQSQRTLQDQNLINITYNAPNTAGQNQHSTSFRNNSQHQYNQPLNQQEIMQQQMLFQQASYYDSQQQSNYQYQPIQYRSFMPQIIEQIQQEQQELQEINKYKNREQEQGIDKLKEEMEIQSNRWNEELRKLRGEVQVNTEKKNRAFYELYNLNDELKKQQLFEEANLKQIKQQIANKKPDNFNSYEKKLITESDYKKSSHQSRQLSNIEDNLFLETFIDQI